MANAVAEEADGTCRRGTPADNLGPVPINVTCRRRLNRDADRYNAGSTDLPAVMPTATGTALRAPPANACPNSSIVSAPGAAAGTANTAAKTSTASVMWLRYVTNAISAGNRTGTHLGGAEATAHSSHTSWRGPSEQASNTRNRAGACTNHSADGPLLLSRGSSDAGMAAEVEGPLTLDEGCLRVGEYPAIWPERIAWDSLRQVLTLPDGVDIALGEQVSGGGGYFNQQSNPVDDYPTEVADLLRSCLSSSDEVAMFNLGQPIKKLH